MAVDRYKDIHSFIFWQSIMITFVPLKKCTKVLLTNEEGVISTWALKRFSSLSQLRPFPFVFSLSYLEKE